jgi:signal transduction histidine kinase/CheY-like chemotaxis protein
MFKLLRYFSLTSALAITAVTVVMVVFYHQSAVSELVASAETHNVSLARSIANTVWPDFAEYVSSVDEDGDNLRQRPETRQLHESLRDLTDGLPVLKVKIYNLQGLTVYSSQTSQMGEDKSGNPGFRTAMDEAKPASKLSFRDSFSAFSGAVENRDLVESYVPIQREDGTVEGVLELYTDVTPLMARLDRNTTNYTALILLICAALYGVLFVLVRRADGILKNQYLELQQNEQNIQAKNTSLEHEIAERQQVEAALRTAKEVAETANRTKSEFLAMVSHEVRTPMNGVLGMAGLLLDSELAQEQREYAQTIQESGESLMTIINDILDFSKAEAGKIELEETEFDLVPLVDNVVELLGSEASGKGIDLAAYLAPDVPKDLRGDDGRIRQILLNLIGNAVKFTSSGGVSLEVTVAGEPSTAAGVVLRFEINDTGIGIPAEARQKIFGSFTQADSSTTRSYGGTGLGLAISEKLVALMGGEIGVESEVGRGSQFWFTAPLKRKGGSVGTWAHDLAGSLRGRRVLVVDDDSINRRVFEKQLGALGMEVTSVAHAGAGLSVLRTAAQAGAPFDIAIVDHMMPDTDGEALAGQIRGEAAFDVKALILSSSSGQVDTDLKAQELGFDAALPKPLRPGLLLKCLNRVFEATAAHGGESVKRAPNTRAEAGTVFRILLAEDNLANQKVVTAMLKSSGFRIDTVANGLEAVEALRNRPYDLVLMDMGMPEMDGTGATRQVRSLSGSVSEIPIIAVTAHAMESDQKACLAAGMNDFITKPIDKAKLLEKIEFWLGLTPTAEVEHEGRDESTKVPARRSAQGHG